MNERHEIISEWRESGEHLLAWQALCDCLFDQPVVDAEVYPLWTWHVAGRYGDKAGGSLRDNHVSGPGFVLWPAARSAMHGSRQQLEVFLQALDDQEQLLRDAAERLFERSPDLRDTIYHLLTGVFATVTCSCQIMLQRSNTSNNEFDVAAFQHSICTVLESFANYVTPATERAALDLSGIQGPVLPSQLLADDWWTRFADMQVAVRMAASMLRRSLAWLLNPSTDATDRPTQSSWILLVHDLGYGTCGTAAHLRLRRTNESMFANSYPDPVFNGVIAFDDAWLKSAASVTQFADEKYQSSEIPTCWSVNFLDHSVANELSQRLLPELDAADLCRTPLLQGDSASGTLAVLTDIACRDSDAHCRVGLTAALGDQGELNAVNGELSKLDYTLWRELLTTQVDRLLVYRDASDDLSEWLVGQARAIRPELLQLVTSVREAADHFEQKYQAWTAYAYAESALARQSLGLIVPQSLSESTSLTAIQSLNVPLTARRQRGDKPDLLQVLTKQFLDGDDWLLTITGGAGAGKTWSSMQLAASMHETALKGGAELLPLWLTADQLLRGSGSPEELVTQLVADRVRRWHVCDSEREKLADLAADNYRDALRCRNVVFVADGWDECNSNLKEARLTDLRLVGRVILFSRPDPRLPTENGVDHLGLEAMDVTLQNDLVERWFASDHLAVDSFQRNLSDRSGNEAVLSTPLFLATCCWLWEERERLPIHYQLAGLPQSDLLPVKPADLLKLFLTAYALRAHRNEYEVLSPAQLWANSEPRIAAKALSDFDGSRWSISSAELSHFDIGRGLFSYRECDGRYQIIHQKFAEWFAARHLKQVVISGPPGYWQRFVSDPHRSSVFWSFAWVGLFEMYIQTTPPADHGDLLDHLTRNGGLTGEAGVQVNSRLPLEPACSLLSAATYTDSEQPRRVFAAILQAPFEFAYRRMCLSLLCNGGAALPKAEAKVLEKRLREEVLSPEDNEVLKILYWSLSEIWVLDRCFKFLSKLPQTADPERHGQIRVIVAMCDSLLYITSDRAHGLICALLEAIDKEPEEDMKLCLLEPVDRLLLALRESPILNGDLYRPFLSRFQLATSTALRGRLLELAEMVVADSKDSVDDDFRSIWNGLVAQPDNPLHERQIDILRSLVPRVTEHALSRLLQTSDPVEHIKRYICDSSTIYLDALILTYASRNGVIHFAARFTEAVLTAPNLTNDAADYVQFLPHLLGVPPLLLFFEGAMDQLMGRLDMLEYPEPIEFSREGLEELENYLPHKKVRAIIERITIRHQGQLRTADQWLESLSNLERAFLMSRDESEQERLLHYLRCVSAHLLPEQREVAVTNVLVVILSPDEELRNDGRFAHFEDDFAELKFRCFETAKALLDTASDESAAKWFPQLLYLIDQDEQVDLLSARQLVRLLPVVAANLSPNAAERALELLWSRMVSTNRLKNDDFLESMSACGSVLESPSRKRFLLRGVRLYEAEAPQRFRRPQAFLRHLVDFCDALEAPVLPFARTVVGLYEQLDEIPSHEAQSLTCMLTSLLGQTTADELTQMVDLILRRVPFFKLSERDASRLGRQILESISQTENSQRGQSLDLLFALIPLGPAICSQQRLVRLIDRWAPSVTAQKASAAFTCCLASFAQFRLEQHHYLGSACRRFAHALSPAEAANALQRVLDQYADIPPHSEELLKILEALARRVPPELVPEILAEYDTDLPDSVLRQLSRSHQFASFSEGVIVAVPAEPINWDV